MYVLIVVGLVWVWGLLLAAFRRLFSLVRGCHRDQEKKVHTPSTFPHYHPHSPFYPSRKSIVGLIKRSLRSRHNIIGTRGAKADLTLLKMCRGNLDKFESLVEDIERIGYDGIEDIIEIERIDIMRN